MAASYATAAQVHCCCIRGLDLLRSVGKILWQTSNSVNGAYLLHLGSFGLETQSLGGDLVMHRLLICVPLVLTTIWLLIEARTASYGGQRSYMATLQSLFNTTSLGVKAVQSDFLSPPHNSVSSVAIYGRALDSVPNHLCRSTTVTEGNTKTIGAEDRQSN